MFNNVALISVFYLVKERAKTTKILYVQQRSSLIYDGSENLTDRTEYLRVKR